MSNLENLISKIASDCEEKAGQIIKTANEEASAIIQKSVDEANKEKESILNDAKDEADKAAERIISGKKLQIRDETLNAKRETMDKVFDVALQKLNQMPEAEYKKFLCDSLSAVSSGGGELILPSHYGIKDNDKLEEFLKNCKNGKSFQLCKDAKKIDGGFILNQGGIEYNYTFETLLGYHRYELES